MADVAIYGQVQILKCSNSINARPIINADFKLCIYKAIALLRLIHQLLNKLRSIEIILLIVKHLMYQVVIPIEWFCGSSQIFVEFHQTNKLKCSGVGFLIHINWNTILECQPFF